MVKSKEFGARDMILAMGYPITPETKFPLWKANSG
jgi:hypothetical protein